MAAVQQTEYYAVRNRSTTCFKGIAKARVPLTWTPRPPTSCRILMFLLPLSPSNRSLLLDPSVNQEAARDSVITQMNSLASCAVQTVSARRNSV